MAAAQTILLFFWSNERFLVSTFQLSGILMEMHFGRKYKRWLQITKFKHNLLLFPHQAEGRELHYLDLYIVGWVGVVRERKWTRHTVVQSAPVLIKNGGADWAVGCWRVGGAVAGSWDCSQYSLSSPGGGLKVCH